MVMDANEFLRNYHEQSADELTPFEGQYVAWSEDGKRILAHAPTLMELIAEIERAGLQDYVIDTVLAPEEVYLGGADL